MKYMKYVLPALAVTAASTASASDATDAITAIGTEAAAIASASWPILIAVVTAFIGMKLFKKFANRST